MKKLIVYRGDAPICVEGFSKDCKRSCQGSLHLYPRKSTTVTDGELLHIKDAYSSVFSAIQVLSVIKDSNDPRANVKKSKVEGTLPKTTEKPVEEPLKDRKEADPKKEVTKKAVTRKKRY